MSKITTQQVSGGTISGITAAQHQTIPNLIHFLDEGPGDGFIGGYKLVLGQPFPTSIIWYTDQTMQFKIVEKLIVRNQIQVPTTITWNLYSTDGVTLVHSVVDNIIYVNNVFESYRIRTIT